jgi:hypothetical protein
MTDTEATDTDPDEAPTPQYLPSAEVVGNLQTYLAALDAEREIIAELVEALENGDVGVDEMVEVMPSPMPMVQYDQERTFDESADYQLTIGGDDGGE